MSRKEKRLRRLLQKPKDYEWDEAVTLLGGFGFDLLPQRGTSHAKFFNKETQKIIMIARPHPSPIMPRWAIDEIISALRESGYINE